ncbi:MAG TPA: VOC family protein [Acidimicrobiia bacterium]|nr:VOC family protein [Acidimicrobiia bacterium]
MSSIGPLVGVILWTSAHRFSPMRSFYVETLGLQPRSDRDRMVNFEWGKLRLTVAVHDEVEGPSRDPLRVMVNLGVADLDLVHQRLLAAGVPCRRPPSGERWGGRVATYLDPDGNVIQLLELPSSP